MLLESEPRIWNILFQFSAAQTENFPLELLESNYNILETFPKYQIEDENLMVLSIAANIEVIWVSCSLALRT
jgi:hypothetical protein